MWFWFHSGWMIILPLAMVVLCILMCVFMRRHVSSGCGTCCGYKRGDSEAECGGRSKPSTQAPGA